MEETSSPGWLWFKKAQPLSPAPHCSLGMQRHRDMRHLCHLHRTQTFKPKNQTQNPGPQTSTLKLKSKDQVSRPQDSYPDPRTRPKDPKIPELNLPHQIPIPSFHGWQEQAIVQLITPPHLALDSSGIFGVRGRQIGLSQQGNSSSIQERKGGLLVGCTGVTPWAALCVEGLWGAGVGGKSRKEGGWGQ